MTAPTSPSMTQGEPDEATLTDVIEMAWSKNDEWSSGSLAEFIIENWPTPSPAQPTAGDVGRIAERVRERFLNASAHKDQWLEILEDAEALANYVLQRTTPTADAQKDAYQFLQTHIGYANASARDALAALLTRERAEAKGRDAEPFSDSEIAMFQQTALPANFEKSFWRAIATISHERAERLKHCACEFDSGHILISSCKYHSDESKGREEVARKEERERLCREIGAYAKGRCDSALKHLQQGVKPEAAIGALYGMLMPNHLVAAFCMEAPRDCAALPDNPLGATML